MMRSMVVSSDLGFGVRYLFIQTHNHSYFTVTKLKSNNLKLNIIVIAAA